jgi:predicted GNAT superfamily acetyltransferase
VATYYRDFYGPSLGIGLYRGLPTDRILVAWHLEDYPPEPVDEETAWALPEAAGAGQVAGEAFRLAIPFDLEELKRADLAAARRLRATTAEVFEAALAGGYRVSGFVADRVAGRSAYLFRRDQGGGR